MMPINPFYTLFFQLNDLLGSDLLKKDVVTDMNLELQSLRKINVM